MDWPRAGPFAGISATGSLLTSGLRRGSMGKRASRTTGLAAGFDRQYSNTTGSIMATDHIRYDVLARDALRGVLRRVLADAA